MTFALPTSMITSPALTPLFDSVYSPCSPMPPTSTATSIDIRTDDFSHPILEEKQCQTEAHGCSTSIGIQCQSFEHLVCRDLTVWTCVEQERENVTISARSNQESATPCRPWFFCARLLFSSCPHSFRSIIDR